MLPREIAGVWVTVAVLLCVATTVRAAYNVGDTVELDEKNLLYQNPHEMSVAGRWKILKVLGTGQVSAYLARPIGDAQDEAEVEAYEYAGRPEEDPEARVLKWVASLQFMTGAQEIKIAKRFVNSESDEQSPYVVTVCGGFKTGMLQYVMVYKYGGKPLLKYYPLLSEDGNARVEVMRKMMKALQYISEKRVLHRDVKPDNILLQVKEKPNGGKEYNPIFIDFGMSVDLDSSTYFIDSKKVGQSRMPLPEWSTKSYSMPVWSHDMFKLGVVFAEMSFGLEIGSKLDPPRVVKNWEDLYNIWNEVDRTRVIEEPVLAPDIDFLRRYMLCERPEDRATPLEVELLLSNEHYRLMMRDLTRSPKGREVDLLANQKSLDEEIQDKLRKMYSDEPDKLWNEDMLRTRAIRSYLVPKYYLAYYLGCTDIVRESKFSVSGDLYEAFRSCDLCNNAQVVRRLSRNYLDEVQNIFPLWRLEMLRPHDESPDVRKVEVKETQFDVLRLYFKMAEYIAKTETTPSRPCEVFE